MVTNFVTIITFIRFAISAAILIWLSPIFLPVYGQSLISPNGYSGIGLVPSARTLHSGEAILDYSRVLPGAVAPKGHNFQVGFGLMEELELVGKLATQDLNCNMFQVGGCPPNTIRDMSASLKLRLNSDWLYHHNAAFAVGVTDVGGAAARFKSYYIVGTKSAGPIEVHLGTAQARGDLAILKGNFSGLDFNPNDWSKLSLQTIGSNSWAHASLISSVTTGGVSTSVTYSLRLNNNPLTPKDWVGLAFNIPLDGVTPAGVPQKIASTRVVRMTDPSRLSEELERHGFYGSIIQNEQSEKVHIRVNNTAYVWSSLDAAGVALGIVAGAYGDTSKAFQLIITTRQIPQMMVSGSVACAKQWLNGKSECEDLKVSSLLGAANSSLIDFRGGNWILRPEIIVSPVITSAVGTEFGSLDFDLGASINTIIPLWQGATWDLNRIEPLGMNTDDFRRDGVYYNARLRGSVNRRMLHQIISMPQLNTQLRLSAGTAYTAWKGHQIETMTQNSDGRHRLSLIIGEFNNNTLTRNKRKGYELATYRVANNEEQTAATEVTYGKFWGGDTGWQILQRFWHGDTNLGIYLRRSKMPDGTPTASFAGLQFTIPLTARRSVGYRYLGVRGVNQWTYALESRIFNRENLLTPGYGEIPRLGESLPQIFNRDRNSSTYLSGERWRLKNAFNELSLE